MERSGWQAQSYSWKLFFHAFDQGAHGSRILCPSCDAVLSSSSSQESQVVLAVWLGDVCNQRGLVNETDKHSSWSLNPDLSRSGAVTLPFASQSCFKQLTQHQSNYVLMWEKSEMSASHFICEIDSGKQAFIPLFFLKSNIQYELRGVKQLAFSDHLWCHF